MTSDLEQRYFVDLAAAFVRGSRPDAPALPDADVIAWGRGEGLKLHKFKRNTHLPRVQRVLGLLRGLQPRTLVDIGSGRGTFLWPLLAAFPHMEVTAVDASPRRAQDLDAVRAGGVSRLTALEADARALPLPDDSADVVTLLEVLEHMERPQEAAAEAARVGRRFAVASVPSKEDNNPEHIHLFDGPTLAGLFEAAGAARVQLESVRGPIIAVARLA